MQPDTQKNEAMVTTFQESLDTMAFVPLDPAEPEATPVGKALLVTMDFNGPVAGQVALVVPEHFAHTLAANFLGTMPDDPEADAKAADSIKELVNVTVGAMMPRLATSREDVFDLSIPQSRAFDVESEWSRFTTQPNTTVFAAEGDTIAIQLRLAA